MLKIRLFMIRNLIVTAFRSLRKNKFFSLLNIFGLAMGMAVFLLIAQYVRFERSYEAFIPDAGRIYRVTLASYLNNDLVFESAENYPGAGPALKRELGEVEDYARLYNLGYKNNVIITNREAQPEPIAFKHRRFLYADSSFLMMMGYPMLKGDPVTALAEPLTAVISEKYARLYFGDQDPIGKTLLMEDDDFNHELVRVTGVFKDLPPNTHLKFDVLFSYKTLFGRFERAPARYDQSWQRKDMYTFIRVKPGTDIAALEAKFPGIIDKYSPGLGEHNRKDVLALQPLKSIHLDSDLSEEPETNGDSRIVFFLGLIGLFVLIIAWINYVNLSTARAVERSREVGVRKVVGALKGHLINQFLVESALINLIAVLLALGITLIALPYFNNISGLSLDYSYLVRPWFLALLLGLWVTGTLLSGIYPALVLSSFRPIMVLKGRFKNSSGGVLLRKGLVVLQFMTSVGLIAGTFVIYRQLKYMINQDIGMDIDQVLVVERPGIAPRDRQAFNSAIDVFRAETLKDPSIEGVSASVTIPGKQREYKSGVKRLGAPDNEEVTVRLNSMDYDFQDVYKMKTIAGRAFGPEFPSDPDTSVILTESAARLIGFEKPEDAIGKTLAVPQFQWNPIVVGVVNDYHQVSLKKALDPMAFYCTLYGGEYYSIRLHTADLPGTISHIRQSWEKAFPGNPFEHFFLDEYFNRQYENERKFGKLFTTFAVLAILIGCLGLLGLSAYTIAQRTKEIGVRKVLGATTAGITALLARDFLRLVLIAIVIATPLAWWIMNNWLQDFASRISIPWWIFAVSGGLAVVVAFLTVSFQSVKAALANPAESLKNE